MGLLLPLEVNAGFVVDRSKIITQVGWGNGQCECGDNSFGEAGVRVAQGWRGQGGGGVTRGDTRARALMICLLGTRSIWFFTPSGYISCTSSLHRKSSRHHLVEGTSGPYLHLRQQPFDSSNQIADKLLAFRHRGEDPEKMRETLVMVVLGGNANLLQGGFHYIRIVSQGI